MMTRATGACAAALLMCACSVPPFQQPGLVVPPAFKEEQHATAALPA
ncbi:hypothetical protein ACLB1G_04650 [Oxalobacteraceae bacterium A2-2]